MKITCILSLLFLLTPSMVSAQTNFDLELVVTGLNLPVDIEASPDNKLFVLEKGGAIKIVENGQVLSQNFLSISVNSDSEQGLLGMAFDPDYSNNGHFLSTIPKPMHSVALSVDSQFLPTLRSLIRIPNSLSSLFLSHNPTTTAATLTLDQTDTYI